jgi:hypothetical protein
MAEGATRNELTVNSAPHKFERTLRSGGSQTNEPHTNEQEIHSNKEAIQK